MCCTATADVVGQLVERVRGGTACVVLGSANGLPYREGEEHGDKGDPMCLSAIEILADWKVDTERLDVCLEPLLRQSVAEERLIERRGEEAVVARLEKLGIPKVRLLRAV